MGKAIQGVITPILTPFEDNGAIAEDLWVSHAKWVLDQGATYLSPFGTTGEALSVSVVERKRALEVLVERGVAADRLMPGTGLCSLAETVELTRHAVELGCAGVMTLPPFFYTGASEDGHFRFFSELIAEIGRDNLKICLYHIPSHAGVGFSPALSARLNEAFPDTIVAYKDSSGDWDNTKAVIDAAPGLAVFPGSESFLTKGLANGGAGCISATCNINAGQIRSVFDQAGSGEADRDALNREDEAMKQFRRTVQDAGLIPAMKALLALRQDEPRWLNLRAPLLNADMAKGEALAKALGASADHI